MDWNKIKEKHPKAYELYKTKMDLLDVCDRQLYDFFDQQGIMICVTPYFGKFETSIENKAGDTIDCQFKDMPTRTEAEDKAYEKSFEILDKKL